MAVHLVQRASVSSHGYCFLFAIIAPMEEYGSAQVVVIWYIPGSKALELEAECALCRNRVNNSLSNHGKVFKNLDQ